MKPYSKDMAGWSEVIMLGAIALAVTPFYCLWWVARVPGRVWRWMK